MKTKLYLILCLQLIYSSNIVIAQSFNYKIFEMNSVVTLNDVVKYLDDNSKLITDPSTYIIGKDIKFMDAFNTTTTFMFYENTQILRCIFIHEITNTAYMEQLRNSVILQLGKPLHGFKIKKTYDIKNNSIKPDFVAYDIQYIYKIGNKSLDFTITHFYPYYFFSVCSNDIHINPDLNVYPTEKSYDNDMSKIDLKLIEKW